MSSLEELTHPELTVTLRGQQYAVKPVDGFSMTAIKSATDQPSMFLALYRATYKSLKPAFTWDEVWGNEEISGFSEDEVLSVMETAQKHVKTVEATVPNDGKAEAAKGGQQTPPLSPPSPQLMKQAS